MDLRACLCSSLDFNKGLVGTCIALGSNSTTYDWNENTTDSFFSSTSSLLNKDSAGIFHIPSLESQSIASESFHPSTGNNFVLSDFTEGLHELRPRAPWSLQSKLFCDAWTFCSPALGSHGTVTQRFSWGLVEISGNIREAALLQVRKPYDKPVSIVVTSYTQFFLFFF
jgi:hypothetical protein